MARQTSSGACNLCGGTFAKASMTKHLKACQQAHASTGEKKQKTFWLTVAGTSRPEYWMHLDVPASARLADLDQFLRDIWLECCGHLSAFTINGIRYELDTGMVDAMWKDFFGPSKQPQSMNAHLYSILLPDMRFDHEYDFGTTTELTLKVIAEQGRAEQGRNIRVLARNLPPEYVCESCSKPATLVCTECLFDYEADEKQGWVCDEHAPDHECGDEMMLPVVNSPRMGECGYTGVPGW